MASIAWPLERKQIRFGKREKINWRTGVERAWTFDTAHGRIVPLSTRRVVCYMPEPA